MRYFRVKIVKDERTVYNRAVLPWEIPLIEVSFGDGNVEETGKFEDTDAPYPDAREEFQRLGQLYGSEPDTNLPFVAAVYGQASTGVRALARAIKEAQADAKVKKPKQSKSALVKEYSSDPLIG